jgi:hypothetical protein
MRPPSYMRPVVERNVVMRRILLHQAKESSEEFRFVKKITY